MTLGRKKYSYHFINAVNFLFEAVDLIINTVCVDG